MSNSITTTTTIALSLPDSVTITVPVQDASTHLVLVYLSQLRAGSRRTMHGALETVAEIISSGEMDAHAFPSFPGQRCAISILRLFMLVCWSNTLRLLSKDDGCGLAGCRPDYGLEAGRSCQSSSDSTVRLPTAGQRPSSR
jgi:hypothetical protein